MILWNKFFIFQVEFSFRAPAIRLRAQPVRPAPDASRAVPPDHAHSRRPPRQVSFARDPGTFRLPPAQAADPPGKPSSTRTTAWSRHPSPSPFAAHSPKVVKEST